MLKRNWCWCMYACFTMRTLFQTNVTSTYESGDIHSRCREYLVCYIYLAQWFPTGYICWERLCKTIISYGVLRIIGGLSGLVYNFLSLSRREASYFTIMFAVLLPCVKPVTLHPFNFPGKIYKTSIYFA